MKKTKNLWTVILFALWIVFIFSRSLQPADLSDEESGRVLALLQQLLPFELSNHVVRKAAHFVEYAFLGFLGRFVFESCQKKRNQIFFALVSCSAVAVCDEIIQLFVEGRAGRVSDVCLDTLGVLAGILAGGVLQALCRRIKERIS